MLIPSPSARYKLQAILCSRIDYFLFLEACGFRSLNKRGSKMAQQLDRNQVSASPFRHNLPTDFCFAGVSVAFAFYSKLCRFVR